MPTGPAADWKPPADWLRIRTLDAHTAGEPLRVILEGFPELRGDSLLDRRRDARERFDSLRTAVMWEPRGHADMYGCLLTPPVTPGADFGILFLHNEGYSTMCGHGVIAVTKVAVETGIVTAREPLTELLIDTPAGLVTSRARVRNGQVRDVAFENVPSFVLALGESVEVPGFGAVGYDLAFGGAFYAYVEAAAVSLDLEPAGFRPLIQAGLAIKREVAASRSIDHPFEDDLGFLYGVVFVGPAADRANHSRNACVFADGEVDRSPTGTSVSARLAIHHARGELGVDESIRVESILGTCFGGRIVDTATFGPHPAVIPEVSGKAHITGRHEFLIDPGDPLRHGFLLR